MCFDQLMHTSKAMSEFADKLFAAGHIEASLIAAGEAVEYCNQAIDAENIHVENMMLVGRHMYLIVDNTHPVVELKEVK